MTQFLKMFCATGTNFEDIVTFDIYRTRFKSLFSSAWSFVDGLRYSLGSYLFVLGSDFAGF